MPIQNVRFEPKQKNYLLLDYQATPFSLNGSVFIDQAGGMNPTNGALDTVPSDHLYSFEIQAMSNNPIPVRLAIEVEDEVGQVVGFIVELAPGGSYTLDTPTKARMGLLEGVEVNTGLRKINSIRVLDPERSLIPNGGTFAFAYHGSMVNTDSTVAVPWAI